MELTLRTEFGVRKIFRDGNIVASIVSGHDGDALIGMIINGIASTPGMSLRDEATGGRIAA